MEQIVKDITGLVGGTPCWRPPALGRPGGFPPGCCASWSI